MIKLGINTQRAERFAQDWLTAQHTYRTVLYDYYSNPSATKKQAFDALWTKWIDLWKNAGYESSIDSHYDWRPIVTAASCHQFTVMYIAPEPTTHEYCLYVETRCNTYYIPLEKTIPAQSQTALHKVRNFVL